MKSQKENAKNRCFLGNLGELKFQTLAFEKGFIVSKPLHNNENYDFIVEFEGKLNKVQVKSTSFYDTHAPGGRYIVKTSRGNFYNSSLYEKKYVDFVVIYVQPCEAWYILPAEDIKTTAIRIYPHKGTSAGGYEQYKNKWDLMK